MGRHHIGERSDGTGGDGLSDVERVRIGRTLADGSASTDVADALTGRDIDLELAFMRYRLMVGELAMAGDQRSIPRESVVHTGYGLDHLVEVFPIGVRPTGP